MKQDQGMPDATPMFEDMLMDMTVMDQEVDQMPSEPEMCTQDLECFAGRICLDGQCADAECQINSDCPLDRPQCFGPEGEDPNQRRGRCGNCEEDLDCFGGAKCSLFEGVDDETELGGICQLDGPCSGSLECAPAARGVLRGSLSDVCLDQSESQLDPICTSAFNCQGEDECPQGLA